MLPYINKNSEAACFKNTHFCFLRYLLWKWSNLHIWLYSAIPAEIFAQIWSFS